MRLRRLFSAAAAGLALFGASPAAARIVEPFQESSWRGAAILDDETGHFKGCIVTADYSEGLGLHFSIDAAWRLSVGLRNRNWTLTQGEEFDLVMGVAEAGSVKTKALATSSDSLIFYITSSRNNFDILRLGSSMTASFKSLRYTFKLTNSSRALDRLMECVRRRASTAAASVEGAKPAPPSASAASVNRQAQRLEAVEIATNMAASANFIGFRIISDAAKRKLFADPDALWQIGAMVGSTHVHEPSADDDMEMIGVYALAIQSKLCKGEFLSSQKREVAAEVKILATSMRCAQTSGHSYVVRHTVIPRKAGGFYAFATHEFEEEDAASPRSPSEASLKDLNLREGALKAASER